MILHQENLEYNKHCAIAFGTYVQAHQEPGILNSQSPRSIDCIYLRYVDNLQGGHHLLDLRTGQTIKRRTVTPVPITQHVIDLVHDMANQDGIPDGLKIETRSGKILFDSAWIAGVDYAEDDNDDDEISIVSNEDNNEDHDEMDPNEIAEILQEPVEAVNINDIADEEADEDVSNNDNVDEEHNNEDNESNPIGEEPKDEENVVEDEEKEESDENEIDDNDTIHDEELDNEVLDDEEIINNYVTRTGRIVRPPEKLCLHQCHLQTQGHVETEYGFETAKMIATQMVLMNEKYSFAETYSLNKGLKKFGERGYDAALNEMRQLHERGVFAGCCQPQRNLL